MGPHAFMNGIEALMRARGYIRARAAAWIMLLLLVGCGSFLSAAGLPSSTVTALAVRAQPTSVTAAPTDWPTYHHDNTRTGYFANEPDPHQLRRAWSVKLDGAVYAEPLVIGNRVVVATEGNSIYSLDRHTGKLQWRTNVGAPVPLSTLPCGNIDPLGITGTPAYDPGTRLVFAVAEVRGPVHLLIGVDVNTGKIRVHRSVDLPGMDPKVHQQRAALAVSQGKVYVAFGGLFGDCGNYRGKVVASRTDGTGPLLVYQVPTRSEGGIWAPPGPTIDAQGRLFVAVGNGEATGGSWDHSDSVLRLSPTLQLQDAFAPTQWAQDNANDADLGSMGPALLPNGLVFADGKAGRGYLLHANALGGIGGQIQVKDICEAYGGSAQFGSQLFIPCTDGLQELMISSGKNVSLGWKAQQATGSPVVGGHTVYSLSPRSGTLYAFNSSTGSVRASLSVGSTSRFATPTLATGQLFVGTLQGVVAVSLS